VDCLAGEAKVGGGGFAVPIWNGNVLAIPWPSNLSPFLRRVILIRQPAFGLGFDQDKLLTTRKYSSRICGGRAVPKMYDLPLCGHL